MATNMDLDPDPEDPDVDMMDIDDDDDDFDADELDAYFQAHGLDEVREPFRWSSPGRGGQQQAQPLPLSKWEERQQQVPPPPPSAHLGIKNSRWTGKGKAVDLNPGSDEERDAHFQAQAQGLQGLAVELEEENQDRNQDHERPPPSYQPPRNPGLRNSRWKGKEKAYGQGDVLGLDGPAGLGTGNSAGFGTGDVLGRDGAGFARGDVLARDSRIGKVRAWLDQAPDLPTIGSNPPPRLSGLSIAAREEVGNKTAATTTTTTTSQQQQTKAEDQGQGGGEGEGKAAAAPIDDPDDSEASIAARPIVSHDPDHPNRPIDLDVRLARGVVRHVLLTEKFPEVWPVPETEAEAEAGVQKMGKGKGDEGQEEENKGTHGQNGVEGVEGAEQKEKAKEADDSKGQQETGNKKVFTPKGVVMLVRSIQYLRMPPEYLNGSQLGSEYGYEGDSQRGSTPASELGNKQPRAHGDEGQKLYEGAYVDDSVDHIDFYSERERVRSSSRKHSAQTPAAGLNHDHDEIPETDLSESTTSQPSTIADSDSDIPMSNTDYHLPPPHSQSSMSRKRTWSQRHDLSSSSSPSSPSPPSPPHYPNIFDNRTPPPRPPSSSSFPSQPPTGPPDLVIRLLLDDGEFWVQAILRPEFHHLVLGHDFDEWASVTHSEEDEQKKGDQAKGDNKEVGKGDKTKEGGGGGKEKTAEKIAREEEEKEEKMQEKWQIKWEEKARGDVVEGVYVRLVGDVVVEFEEVDVEDGPQPQPMPVPMKNDNGMSKGQEKEKGINGVNGKRQDGGAVKGGEKMDIEDDGIGDPEKLERLRREAMERKWLGKGKEVENNEKAMVTEGQEVDKPKEDEKPKTTKMVCLVVGHMVPVGWDRKFMREVKKAQLKAMAEELGPVLEVSSTTGDEMDLEKKKKEEPEQPKQPWWVPTGYRAELEAREQKRRREAEARAKEAEEAEKAKEAERAKEWARLWAKNENLLKAEKAKPSETKRPDPRRALPPEWKDLNIFEVDRLLKEWDKQNRPKEPKPPKPPNPDKNPIITARQAPQFHPSLTAQEVFFLQNPGRKPVKKAPEPAYVAAELGAFRGPQDTRPAAIVDNQQMQRKKILELPPRGQRRPQQGPGPRLPPHLQPNPLLQPPRHPPQGQIRPHPQPYSVAQPDPRPHPRAQPQIRPQPRLQPQPRPQLPPQPPARQHFQPQAPARPQFLQQQPPPPQPQPHPRPQPQPQHAPRLPPQPPPHPPPKPNPHLATDPTVPLRLCTLSKIPLLPYPQNWMVNVLAIVVSISDVEPSPMPPTFTQRIVRLADQSTSKHVLLNVFLDAEDFNPKPGEVVLLMGVKNHKFEGGCLKKYWSDRPPEGCKWRWWVGEEVLGGIGWCRGGVERLRGWWREREREEEREREREGGGG